VVCRPYSYYQRSIQFGFIECQQLIFNHITWLV